MEIQFTDTRQVGADQTSNGGFISVTTTAAKIIVQCVPSASRPTLVFDTPTGDYNITGSLNADCTVRSYGDPVLASKSSPPWSGWAVYAPQACVPAINATASTALPPGYETLTTFFAPVAFSYLANSTLADFVFCSSNVEVHKVNVALNTASETIEGIEDLGFVQDLGQGPNG